LREAMNATRHPPAGENGSAAGLETLPSRLINRRA
jgi:hypothetical protein